jgi:hypothetical protein
MPLGGAGGIGVGTAVRIWRDPWHEPDAEAMVLSGRGGLGNQVREKPQLHGVFLTANGRQSTRIFRMNSQNQELHSKTIFIRVHLRPFAVRNP